MMDTPIDSTHPPSDASARPLLRRPWFIAVMVFGLLLALGALCVLLVVISFIDAEHMIIPMNFVYAGMAIGLIGGER